MEVVDLKIKSIYTYIQSRFYRAPEIILGIKYTTAIDMWSFGCILYELFTGVPLFAGEDESEQMQLIMEVKGIPPVSVIKQGSRWRSFFHSNFIPRQIQSTHNNKVYTPNSKKLSEMVKSDDPSFSDFIDIYVLRNWISNYSWIIARKIRTLLNELNQLRFYYFHVN